MVALANSVQGVGTSKGLCAPDVRCCCALRRSVDAVVDLGNIVPPKPKPDWPAKRGPRTFVRSLESLRLRPQILRIPIKLHSNSREKSRNQQKLEIKM